MTEETKAVATSCINCLFAEWFDHGQTGCSLGRWEKFAENGAELIVRSNEDVSYMEIYGRFCNACRDSSWGVNHPWQDWRDIVFDEISVRVSVVINACDSTSLQECVQSIESVLEQKQSAAGIIIGVKVGSDLGTNSLVGYLRSNSIAVPWQVVEIKAGYDMDEAVKCVDSTYYLMIKSGYNLPADYLYTINYAINNEMMRFVALRPDEDGNGLLVQTWLHNQLRGNTVKPIIDKVVEIAGEEKTEYMIKSYQELPRCESQS